MSIPQHDLVQDLIRVRAEIGRIPTKREYTQFGRYSYSQAENTFGLWSLAVRAAFGDHRPEPKKKRFDSIEERLGEYYQKHTHTQLAFPVMKILQSEGIKIASTGDIHSPFVHLPSVSLFYLYIEMLQPDIILLPGDLYDMFAHAKFPRSLLTYNPEEEYRLARQFLEGFFKRCRELCPKAKIIALCGNHDVRPIKRIQELYPEGEMFILDGIKKALTFEGVETIFDPREIVHLGEDIYANHGHFMNLGDHARNYKKKMIVGHTHRGGTIGINVGDGPIWELNCGLMGDPNAKCMGYTPTKQNNWTNGFGSVTGWGPQFIHVPA